MSALGDAKTLAKYNNDLERANVKLQYDYNRSLAQEDRSWQERMANSAHQREIADLKAAGLNPVLSVTGGNGAATPSGSATSVSKPNVDTSLPRAVMDMAIAQLNSATALQTTAMNNANSLQVKQTTSGDSLSGQLRNLGENYGSWIDKTPWIKNAYERFATKKNDAYLKASVDYATLALEQSMTNTGTKQYRRNKRKLRKLEKRLAHYER